MKLSIIMPCYGVEQYIERAYKSLTGIDVEIIAIIDGSPDNTEAVLREISKNDSRIRIISRQNKGYFNTIVECIENAKGEYIKILEPDDELVTGTIIDFLKKSSNADLYIYNVDEVRQKDGKTNVSRMTLTDPMVLPTFIHSMVFKKSLCNPLRQLDIKRFSYSDLIISSLVRSSASTVEHIDQACYRYYVGHEGQSTNSENILKNWNNYLLALEAVKILNLENYKYMESAIKHYIKRALFLSAISGKYVKKELYKSWSSNWPSIGMKLSLTLFLTTKIPFSIIFKPIMRKLYLKWEIAP